jgi:hypothetical protein
MVLGDFPFKFEIVAPVFRSSQGGDAKFSNLGQAFGLPLEL